MGKRQINKFRFTRLRFTEYPLQTSQRPHKPIIVFKKHNVSAECIHTTSTIPCLLLSCWPVLEYDLSTLGSGHSRPLNRPPRVYKDLFSRTLESDLYLRGRTSDWFTSGGSRVTRGWVGCVWKIFYKCTYGLVCVIVGDNPKSVVSTLWGRVRRR